MSLSVMKTDIKKSATMVTFGGEKVKWLSAMKGGKKTYLQNTTNN